MFSTGFCNGMGVGGWVLMIGFWTVLLGVIVWAVTRLFPSHEPTRDVRTQLDRWLATGEIDPATYRAVRDELTAASVSKRR